MRLLLLLVVAGSLATPALLGAEDAPQWVGRTVDRLPRTLTEVVAEHARHEADCCEEVRPGQPLVVPDFSMPLEYVMGTGNERRVLKYHAGRRPVLSLGTIMTPQDQATLPGLSSDAILERVNGDFIAVEIRVHREDPDGAPYLYYRPLAAVGGYGSPTSRAFAPVVRTSIRDMRSLGLVIDPRQPVRPEHLRTLAMVFKSSLPGKGAAAGTAQPAFEFLFVRCRVGDAIAGEQDVTLHAFATSDERTALHHFPTFDIPAGSHESHIRSTIYFTRWGITGLNPVERAARSAEYNSRNSFTLDELDAHAAAHGRAGGALDHLTWTLDEIIDGQLDFTAADKPAAAKKDAPKKDAETKAVASPQQ